MVRVCVAAWIGLWAGWVGFGWMASVASQGVMAQNQGIAVLSHNASLTTATI